MIIRFKVFLTNYSIYGKMKQMSVKLLSNLIIPAGLILSAGFIFSNFAYAFPDLPSNCPGTIEEYVSPKDFIIVEDGNSADIDGGNGEDCILVGNNNTAEISGGGGNDTIILGNANSGEVNGGGGEDIIELGNNNSGNIAGGTGVDTITIGNDNGGDIDLNGGNDVLQTGSGNFGTITGGTGDDTVTVGETNSGNITGDGGNDTVIYGYGNTGVIDVDVENIIAIPPAPSADPLPGTFNSVQEITLLSDGAASIFYTTDGSTTPDCSEENGELYESPFLVSSTKNIRAIACTEEGYGSPVASFNYAIELKTDPAGLASVLEAVFVPAPGELLSLTQSLTVSQDLEINTTASGSKIILDQATVITRADDQPFDATALTSSEADTGLLAGLTEGNVFEAALQWGIASISLEFDPAITINIFVGTAFNGQTLNVVRSVTGTSDWTTDGIVLPSSCLVVDGICSFQATKASVYAAVTESPIPEPTPPPLPTPTGGGTIWFPQLYNPAPGPSEVKPAESSKEEIPPEQPAISPVAPVQTPAVKVAVVPKPQVVVSKNASTETVTEKNNKNNEVAAIAAAIPQKSAKSFILFLFASMGRMFAYPFYFFK